MENKVFQGVLFQMQDTLGRVAGFVKEIEEVDETGDAEEAVVVVKEVGDVVAGVVDETGVVVACTDITRIGETVPGAAEQMAAGDGSFLLDGFSFSPFSTDQRSEYAAFVQGEEKPSANAVALLAVSLLNILQYHDEKFDKANFIKNVVTENILSGDVYAKARELHFATDVTRVVLLIRVISGSDVSALEVVGGLFPEKRKDFVFNVNENDTVLVKEIKRGIGEHDIENLAASIIDMLNGEYYIRAVVGIGTLITSIRDLSRSFKEAQIALEVAKVFDTERSIISYNHLGIGRLVYQLPTTLCEMFLKEVFIQGSIESLDEETLFTIQRFFENNLNVSETSRGLFVHRNTLVYRLERIKKITGLDLREFEDAIVFKVALMVKKYLAADPSRF